MWLSLSLFSAQFREMTGSGAVNQIFQTRPDICLEWQVVRAQRNRDCVFE